MDASYTGTGVIIIWNSSDIEIDFEDCETEREKDGFGLSAFLPSSSSLVSLNPFLSSILLPYPPFLHRYYIDLIKISIYVKTIVKCIHIPRIICEGIYVSSSPRAGELTSQKIIGTRTKLFSSKKEFLIDSHSISVTFLYYYYTIPNTIRSSIYCWIY